MNDQAALKNVEDIYPLSPMQQAMLIESLQRPESPSYFEQFTFLIRGPLDADAYQRAWNWVLNRHAVLRSQFVWQDDDKPLQVVMREVELPWRTENWTSDDAPDLDAFLESDRRRLIRTNRPPLMRITLARTGDAEHRVIWSFHHILVDAWAVSVMLNDIDGAYRCFLDGREPEAEPVVKFRDAIAAMLKRPQGAGSGAEAYWRGLLRGLESPTPLAARRSEEDAAGRPRQLRTFAATLAGDRFERVVSFGRENRLTLGTLTHAAWALVLARCAMADEVVFGTTLSGRGSDVPGVDRIVGLLMNAAPVRARIADERPLLDWLRDVQRQISESARFEQTALTDIHAWSDMPRRSPLFESVLVFGNHPLDDARSGAAPALRLASPKSYGWTPVPLTLMVTPHAGLEIEARFDEAVLDGVIVERMLEATMQVLDAFTMHAHGVVGDIEMLDEDERRRVLSAGIGPQQPANEATIHDLFREQVARTPDAAAFRLGGRTLTFTELDRLSAAVAQALVERGVAPGSPVGVCIDPSFEAPVALLGVLRAGCCYVPLDAGYPTARLEHIVRDASPSVILVRGATSAAAPRTGADIVDVDQLPATTSEGPWIEPPDGVAYVIYTSGSTGAPKGVRGSHRGAVNRFRWMWSFRPFGADDVCSWRTTINFVDHVWEIFGPLLAGVGIEILDGATVKDPDALIGVLRKTRVTRLVVVPSLLEMLLDMAPDLGRRLPQLRLMVSSGESLPWALARRLRAAAPDVELVNLYGSSEVAADVTHHVVTDEDMESGRIPIGRPIDNVSIALLDERLHPVPSWLPGIVHVGGDCLAFGYHERPDLTAERFIPNPHDDIPTKMLFRTGDLARWNENGELEFLGRSDNQVKIRGSRVEPGEVEFALGLHPSVAEAAVVCRDTAAGPALLAYVVQTNGAVDVKEIRRFLRGRLPEYMTPSLITPISALPRTPNGKLDRAALPEPETAAEIMDDDPTVVQIAEIFATLLGLPRVQGGDCFFDLGGNSVLAVKLAARLEKTFGASIPLVTFLRASTPRDLAPVVSGDDARSSELVVPIRADGTRTPFFCVHGMDGNILFLHRLQDGLSPDQPIYGVMAQGVDGGSEPLRSIEAMADAYVDAIRSVQPRGPYVIGGYSLGGMIALEMAHRLVERGEEVRRIVLIDTRIPRAAGSRSLKKALSHRLRWHLKRGPRLFLKTLYYGPIERNAWRFCRMTGLPMPRRLRVWPVRLASLNAYMRHRPRSWGGPVTLLRAEKQEDEFRGLHALGWERFARGELDVHPLPSDHLNFFGKESIGVVSSALESVLAESAVHAPVDSGTV